MGRGEGASETPATSFRDPIFPCMWSPLGGGVDSVVGRNGQRCVLTDTVLEAVASVPVGREQDVAGGAGEGLLGPERSVGGAWQ